MHELVKAAFVAALEAPASGREHAIREVVGEDEQLFAEALSLVQAHEAASGFLGEVTTPDALPAERAVREGGDQIGPYRLVREIGSGGFGAVWLARQQEPVQRDVALKMLHAGLRSADVLRRFDAERDALARMAHSHVAKVFDAGITEDGRPFIAMEYVEGPTLAEFCTRHRLSLEDRLRLFCSVCNGIAHAHARGVVHRDIKPSNVLVATEDGVPRPKVIDFGIAKAVMQDAEDVETTRTGQLVGTPAYMSPEQLEHGSAAVDTRSDVYALGILLFEMLTESAAVDLTQVRGKGMTSVLEALRRHEHERPSRRLATADAARARRLVGDLDWITLRALEREPDRRYQSVRELAEDVERHLAHEAVHAAPPSTAYRVHKFVRRNRALVSSVLLVALALGFGLVGTLWQAALARDQRDRALSALRRADAVNEYLTVDLLRQASPEEALGKKLTVAEVFLSAADQLDTRFADQPDVHGALRQVVGTTLRQLGLFDEALPNLRRAVELHREALGDEDRRTLKSAWHLASLQLELGQRDEGTKLLQETLAGFEQHFGVEDQDAIACRVTMANDLVRQSRHAEALALRERVHEEYRRTLGDAHPYPWRILSSIGMLHEHFDRLDQAEATYREVRRRLRSIVGDEHPETLSATHNLACLLGFRGRYAEAAALYEVMLPALHKIFGRVHPDALYTINAFATLLQNRHRAGKGEPLDLERAIRLFDEALEIRGQIWGEEHERYATGLNNRAVARMLRGDSQGAREDFAAAVRIHDARNPRSRAAWTARMNLARARAQCGELAAGVRDLEFVLANAGDAMPVGSTLRAIAELVLAELLADQKTYDEAEPLLRRSHAVLKQRLGAAHVRTRNCARRLSTVLQQLGRTQESELWRDRAEAESSTEEAK